MSRGNNPGKLPLPTVVGELRRHKRHVVCVWKTGGQLTAPSSESAGQERVFRLNDYYDPDYRNGGEPPYDYSYWNNRWNRYRVNAAKWHIKFETGQGATVSQPVGFYVISANEAETMPGTIGETLPVPSNEAQWYTLQNDRRIIKMEKNMTGYARQTNKGALELTGFCNTNRYAGIARGQKNIAMSSTSPYDPSDPFATAMGHHPLRSHYLVLYTRSPQHGGTTAAIYFTLTLTFYITFWDRKGGLGWASDALADDIIEEDNDVAATEEDAPTWDLPAP